MNIIKKIEEKYFRAYLISSSIFYWWVISATSMNGYLKYKKSNFFIFIFIFIIIYLTFSK